MSTVFGVEDDGTPRAALDIAGQAVRAFNHQTFSRPELGREGWQFASDQYSALGKLTYMVGMLPQVFAQITAGLRSQLEAGALGVDRGTEGTPPEKVARADAELQQASLHAQAMYRAIAAAQSAIAAVHNVDPVSAS